MGYFVKIAFMHIPKTGGISVERSIAAAVPADATTCPTYFAPDYAGKTYDDVPGYDIYHGHFDFGFLKTVPDTYKRVIVLRQPADQILSLCNHIASRKEHALHEEAQGSSLAELLNNNHSLHNQMTKHLLGKAHFKEVMLGKGAVKDKVAAVMPDGDFRRQDQADIVVLSENVSGILAAMVERYHLTAHGGAVGVTFFDLLQYRIP